MMPIVRMQATRIQQCTSRGGRRWLERAPFLPSSQLLRGRCFCQAVKAEQPTQAKSRPPPTPKKKKNQNPEEGKSVEEIRELRAEKIKTLREAGNEPFAYSFDRTAMAAELQESFKHIPDGEEATGDDAKEVRVAGRVIARRVMGKLAFVTLRDDSGTIQLYVDKSRLETGPEGFKQLKGLIDVGDFIGAAGTLKRTDKGELSVVSKWLQVLTKSYRAMPDKWHGLQDVEKRYRQRYVDLIASPSVKETFQKRSMILSTIRRSLEDSGFLEVETPVLETVAGGADARPFVTFHNTLKRNFTLRIATELHLKRLVVGGFERVFEVGRIFRNEGISTRHNPEFTSIEVYQAYADYVDMMKMTENLIRSCAERVCDSLQIQYGDLAIDLNQPFRRASMYDLVHEVTGTDFWNLREDPQAFSDAAEAASPGITRGYGDVASGTFSTGRVVNALFEELVEETLQQPTFVTDHPVEISPLAKSHREKEGLVERFELFVAGRELANSFSELTDPEEQRKRLEAQVEAHAAARAASSSSKEVDPEMDYEVAVDSDFVTALEYGMPPTAGMGMGVDRLVMLLTDSHSIRDVIAFPLMK